MKFSVSVMRHGPEKLYIIYICTYGSSSRYVFKMASPGLQLQARTLQTCGARRVIDLDKFIAQFYQRRLTTSPRLVGIVWPLYKQRYEC